MVTNSSPKFPKKSPTFICKQCNIRTRNKKDYTKHLLTRKHINNDAELQGFTINPQKNPKEFICICGKKYKYRQGLCVHKKKCNYEDNKTEKNTIIELDKQDDSGELKEIIIQLITENADIKNTMIKENTDIKNTMIEENTKLLIRFILFLVLIPGFLV